MRRTLCLTRKSRPRLARAQHRTLGLAPQRPQQHQKILLGGPWLLQPSPGNGRPNVATIRDRHSGTEAVIDEVDLVWAQDLPWYMEYHGAQDTIYFHATVKVEGKRTHITLHREVAKRAGVNVQGKMVVHRDRNTLNCQRANLEAMTKADAIRFLDTRPHKGTSFSTSKQRFRTRITVEGKTFELGNNVDKSAGQYLYEKGVDGKSRLAAELAKRKRKAGRRKK